MRCRWLKQDGTCELDGTRCPGDCIRFEPEEYPHKRSEKIGRSSTA